MLRKNQSPEDKLLEAWAILGFNSTTLKHIKSAIEGRTMPVDEAEPVLLLLNKSIPLLELEEKLMNPKQLIWTPYFVPLWERTLIPDGPELEMGNPYPKLTDCNRHNQIAVWNSAEKRWEFNYYYNFNHPDNEGEKEKEIIAMYPRWKPLRTETSYVW